MLKVLGSFSIDLIIEGSLLLIITVNMCGRIGIKEIMTNRFPSQEESKSVNLNSNS